MHVFLGGMNSISIFIFKIGTEAGNTLYPCTLVVPDTDLTQFEVKL